MATSTTPSPSTALTLPVPDAMNLVRSSIQTVSGTFQTIVQDYQKTIKEMHERELAIKEKELEKKEQELAEKDKELQKANEQIAKNAQNAEVDPNDDTEEDDFETTPIVRSKGKSLRKNNTSNKRIGKGIEKSSLFGKKSEKSEKSELQYAYFYFQFRKAVANRLTRVIRYLQSQRVISTSIKGCDAVCQFLYNNYKARIVNGKNGNVLVLNIKGKDQNINLHNLHDSGKQPIEELEDSDSDSSDPRADPDSDYVNN